MITLLIHSDVVNLPSRDALTIAFISSRGKRTGTILPLASPFGSFGLPTFLDFFCWLKASKLLYDRCPNRIFC
jgi:hypothetical protein